MHVLILKKILFIFGLVTLAPFFGLSSKDAAVTDKTQIEAVRSENEFGLLEEKFQSSSDFDATKVNELVKIRIAEEGSITPLQRNIEAMLLLWDAGVRNPNVFMATILKDTQIDQTLIVHLYGPEVSALLNEMHAQDEEAMSSEAKLIVAAFSNTPEMA
jgi:hypothetical protein